jgi:hypothetical protein
LQNRTKTCSNWLHYFKFANNLLNPCFVAFVAPVFGVLQILEFLCFQNIFQKLEQQEQHFFLTINYAVIYKINKEQDLK